MLNFATQAAKLAGDRLLSISKRSVNSDAGNDVKLQEDVDSEMFIRETLSETKIPVIGEEQGGDVSLIENDEYYWIVDPIDGTYNYLRNMPGVCVSVALMKGWTPVVGAIYDFTRGELFAGGKGLPLTLNGEKIKPNWEKRMEQACLITGFPSLMDYSDDGMKFFIDSVRKFKKVRMYGTAALAMAWVACGRADVYSETKINLWDIAAGLALLDAAGGAYKISGAGVEGKPLCILVDAASCKEFLLR